jgi:GrpB-like predicted nucleotidyltransferase (UPF0157 family)
MDSKRSLAGKPHLLYGDMLKAMPPDIVKELARRRLEEIQRYQAEKKARRNAAGKK